MPELSRRSLSWQRWALLLLLLAAWALRLHRLDMQDIWWDEARNIDVATRPLAQIAPAPELDIHPPLYFYALHAWTRLAGSVSFATRFFSAWFGMLTLALVYRLGLRLGGPRARQTALLAVLLAAAAPFALGEAQETRMYTVSWALLAAGQLALWHALEGWQQIRRWGPFVLLTAAALLTHYATATIVLTWAIWLLAWAMSHRQRWLRLRMLLLAGAGVVLLWLPVLPIAWRQIPGYDNPNLVLPGLGAYLSQLYRSFTLGDTAPASLWQVGRWLWALAVAGGLLSWLVWGRRALPSRQRLILLVTWLVGGLAVFYLILVTRSAFNPRYISFILPALWVLGGWALAGWACWDARAPWLAGVLLLALSLPGLRADLYDPAYFREDMRGVIAYLHAQSTPQDIILVDQRYPFGFYWQRWNNDFYGMPPAEPATEAPAQYLFVDLTHDDARRLDRRLQALAGNARQVFYVTWFESDMDPRGAVPALLNAAGTLVEEVPFRGYKVRRWLMQPPTQFALPDHLAVLDQKFAGGVVLQAGDWLGREAAIAPESMITVSLRWQVQQPTAQALKVSLRLKDAAGATLAQDDRLLLSDRHVRSTAWQPGESALNIYQMPAPQTPGVYAISVVLYDADSLAPVSLADGSGVEPVIGEVWVGTP